MSTTIELISQKCSTIAENEKAVFDKLYQKGIEKGIEQMCMRNFTSVSIPEGVTSIRTYMFYNCSSLKSVTIPSSVTRIESYAFWNCYNLTDVYYAGTEEEWNAITIISCDDLANATIHYNS